MATPNVALGRATTPERSEREALLDRLAHLVAACDDHNRLARLVTDLEAITNSSLGPTNADSTVVLARRFARAHRLLVTGASAVSAAGIRIRVASFEVALAGLPDSVGCADVGGVPGEPPRPRPATPPRVLPPRPARPTRTAGPVRDRTGTISPLAHPQQVAHDVDCRQRMVH